MYLKNNGIEAAQNLTDGGKWYFQLFTAQFRLLTTAPRLFENIVGKEVNALNKHFLLFPQCFLSYPKQILPCGSPLILSSAKALNLNWSKVLSFGKELKTRNIS